METPREVGTPVVPEKRPFPWGATVLLVVVFGLMGAFAWRVGRFYTGIQNGSVTAEAAYASSRSSVSETAAAFAARASGESVLATNDDPMLGSANAVLTIVEFGDFGCPFTRQESYVMRALAQKYPDTIRYIYRDFPLEDLHPGAELAARAGYCAHKQGKFWEYHDEVFRAGAVDEESVLTAAVSAGVTPAPFLDCLESDAAMAEVETDLADGYAGGVVGTPTFFLNGEMVEGAIPYEIFVAIIEAFAS